MNNSLIAQLVLSQRDFYGSGESRNLKFRLAMLSRLKEALLNNEQLILSALEQDLRKPPFESYSSELGFVLAEINIALKNLKHWAKDKRVGGNLLIFPSKSYIISEPYGVALIFGPWNFPFQLTLAPLVGAIAAGNCAILKPSGTAKASSAAIKKIIDDSFDESYIAVVESAEGVNDMLLEQCFDKIFFTGSQAVGRIVMEKAAKHLTSVTLELGGKTPCLVDRGIDLELTAKRIVWGKFFNAGQTCIAPDYILVHKDVKEDLLKAMINCLESFYGSEPKESPDLSRIVSKDHFNTLKDYLADGKIIAGGECDESSLYLAPTILEVFNCDAPVMKEEIFGPILPVIEFERFEEAEEVINLNPSPLAFYIFSNDQKVIKELTRRIPFGGGTVNDVYRHMLNFNLPFGGRNNSGIGSYRGKKSFETFSHQKSLVIKGFGFDAGIKYPPYRNIHKLVRKVIPWIKL